MVVRMRHTRAHTKNRRSHHALEGARLSTSEGGVKHPRHKALLDGTPYRGRSILKKAEKTQVGTSKKVESKAGKVKKTEDKKESKEKVTEK